MQARLVDLLRKLAPTGKPLWIFTSKGNVFAMPHLPKEIIRYQHSPWYVKFWRWRWKLCVPFEGLYIWLANLGEESLGLCWRIANGLAEYRMHWFYDWKDIKFKDDDSGDIR